MPGIVPAGKPYVFKGEARPFNPILDPSRHDVYGLNDPEPQDVSYDTSAPSYFEDPYKVEGSLPSFFTLRPEYLPEDLAEARATRYNFSITGDTINEEEIFNEIRSGNEDIYRARKALEDRTDLNVRRANLIRAYTENLPAGELTGEKLSQLQALDKKEVEDAYANPATFYERKFANKVRQISYEDETEQQPEVKFAIDSYNDVLINQATARKFFEDYQYDSDTDRTWGQAIKPWIPFYRWSVLSSAYESSSGRSFWLGENIRQQIEDAYRLSPDEFFETQKKVLDDLKERDPELALHYATSLLGYTSSDKFADNLNSYLDLSIFTPSFIAGTAKGLGKLSVSGVRGSLNLGSDYLRNLQLTAVHGRMKNKLRGMGKTNLDYSTLLPEARRVHQRAYDSLRKKAANTGQVKDFDELFEAIQDIHNPESILTGSGDMTAEAVARMELSLLKTRTNAMEDLLARPRTLPRLSEEEISLASTNAEKYWDRMYAQTSLAGRIAKIKLSNVDAQNTLINTDAISIYVGNKQGGGYASSNAAKGAGTKLGLQRFTTEEIDGKWYIKFYDYVDEKDATLHAFRTPNKKYANKERTSFLAPFLSRVRMRENLVPEQLSEDILATQSGTNAYFQANEKQFIEDFSKLNKQSKKDLDHYLEMERDYRVEADRPEDVIRGRYSNNVGELRTNFSKEMGRQPTPEEIETYFSWKTWNDIDYATRNLDLTRDMARLGIKSHKLLFRFPGAEEVQRTPTLEGKTILDPEIVWNRQGDAGILVWDPSETHLMFGKDRVGRYNPDKGKVENFPNPSRKADVSKDQQEYINHLVREKGYVFLQLTPWAKKTLQETMETWGGFAPKPPTPYKPPVPQSEAEKSLAKLQEKHLQYLEKAFEAKGLGNHIDEAFYRAMAGDTIFRKNLSDKVPENIHERANALIDVYTENGTVSGIPNNLKRSAKDEKGFLSVFNRVLALRRELGRPFRKGDVEKLTAANEGALTTTQRKNFGAKLHSKRTKSTTEDAKALSVDNTFTIKAVTSNDPDKELVGALHKGRVEIKTSPYKQPKAAPYYIISQPNKGLDEGIDVIVLNDSAKVNKKELEQTYPQYKYLTINQAEEYFKSGKLPGIPSLEERVAIDTPTSEFTPGDVVHILTPADKKELAAKGYLEGIEGSQKYKVQNISNDPDKHVQVEGSATVFPAEDLYLVSKAPDVPPDKVRGYMEGLELSGKQRYDYILVRPEDGLETSALNFMRFPRREGGHKIIEDEWKVIQPDVYSHKFQASTVSTYEGDINMYTATTEKEARLFNDRLNEIKRILKDDLAYGNNNAEAFYNRYLDGTSKDWKTFKKQFKQVHGSGHLDLDHVNVVAPRDHSGWKYINDLKDANGNPVYPNLQNQRDSAHNLFHNDLNLQFALQRSDNLESVIRKGTLDNPVFGTETGGNLSPMATLINSSSQLIRGRLVDDLKIKSAENFGKAFASVIDATPEEIARDPMKYLINPQWKTKLKGQDASLLLAAKDYRRAVTDFIGIKTPTQEWMEGVQQQIAEGVQNRLGGQYQWIDQHLRRSSAVAPLRWANSMVFDLYFGVFNIKQLATQAMSSYHTAAVLGPEMGMKANFSAMLSRWALNIDDVAKIDYIAGVAEKSGLMKAAEFKEALAAYKNTGFHIIRQETALEDDFINQTIKPSLYERSKDTARFFFKEGDRHSRSTGWFGAYLEWRRLNPTATLNQRASYEILKRANDLTLNMTAASQSQIAKGVGNIPLKFTTYYLRVMEQLLPGFTGSRLTAKEKMRAYAMYAALFGVPVTASGAFGLWPFHKEVAKALNDAGYETDENLVLKAFNGGLSELIPHLVGVDQNFAETLGPSGTTWMYDIYHGRSPLFDIITGVGGTKLEDTFESTWPFFTFMANVFRTDDKKYPLSITDLEHLGRSVSSVNNVWRSIQMYNTGVYMSLNGTPLMRDVTSTDAAMNLIFGTQPTELQQAFIKSDMTRTTREMKKTAGRDIQRYHRLQMKAIADGDLDAAIQHGKAIKWLLQANGFTPSELNRVFSDTVSFNKDLVTLAEKNFNASTPERQRMYLDKIRQEREAK